MSNSGSSFVWMVTANEFQLPQQLSARNSSYLDHMALPHLDKKLTLPSYFKCNANAAYRGQYTSDLPSLYAGQPDGTGGFGKPLQPYCNTSYPTGNPYPKDSHCVLDKQVGSSFGPQRRFLIFDQFENHTRLFFSPSFCPKDQIFTSKTNGSYGKLESELDQMKPIIEEKWDENHLSDGEGNMLEDSEELNALLYTDSDDDGYDDDDGEDDEVTSTGHSPFILYNREKPLYEEELASCDESPKRQRLLDGKYKKPSLESVVRLTTPSPDPCSYEDDCVAPNKAKIREALKMLESIIPGLDSKDPLSIIDGAVAYLKSMKTEVESLGPLFPPRPLL